MAKVVTIEGHIHTASKGEKGNARPLTDEEAARIAKMANAEAEKLGIKMRYEVAE